MDTDANDTSTGVTDTLNGETKPDPAKLAQQAIIKQVGTFFSEFCFQNNTTDFLFCAALSERGGGGVDPMPLL